MTIRKRLSDSRFVASVVEATMKRVVILVAAGALMATVAAQSKDATAFLQAAQIKDEIQNDLKAAIPLYEQAVKAAAADRAIAPRALLALAGAYERAGRPEARAAYLRIVNDYADSGSPFTTARSRLATLQRNEATLFKEINLDAQVQLGASQAVSPDGRRIAYVAWREVTGETGPARPAVYVRELGSDKERRLSETFTLKAFAPTLHWSPDSQHILFRQSLALSRNDGSSRLATAERSHSARPTKKWVSARHGRRTRSTS